jgi:hypothetical protein
MASVLRDSTQKLHQHFDGAEINWEMTEKQFLNWEELFRRGKKLKLDVCVNYVADDNNQASIRNGEKRNTRSITNAMLADREARIDAEQSSGQYSHWRNVYDKMKCPGPPCKNSEGYCWQDPVGKKHYRLNTHHLTQLVDMVKKKNLCLQTHEDVPNEIRRQLYAEEQKLLDRKQRAKKNSSVEPPYLPININVLPTPSPQPSMMATPADSPPSVPNSNSSIVDPIVIPDLPLDEAVKRYATWHKSRVASQEMKDNVDLACQIALSNGFDLRQIDKDRNCKGYTDEGVLEGVARRWTDEVRDWLDDYEPLF